MKRSKPVQTKAWEKTKVQNLVRHKSGRYYARIYAGGKETWKALKTDLLEVAKAKLQAVAPALDGTTRAAAAQDRGCMPLGDGATILRERPKTGTSMPGRGKPMRRLRPNSVLNRGKCIDAIFRTRPAWETIDVRNLKGLPLQRHLAKECLVTRWGTALGSHGGRAQAARPRCPSG